jgi:hypothetical protein
MGLTFMRIGRRAADNPRAAAFSGILCAWIGISVRAIRDCGVKASATARNTFATLADAQRVAATPWQS